jgi:hypothetical protein
LQRLTTYRKSGRLLILRVMSRKCEIEIHR